MTDGPVAGQLLRFALPLFVGNLFQQLYNTADALIVGNLLGSGALAAVSGTGNLTYLLISFFEGLAMGAGVAISRFFGSGERDKMRRAIHTDVAMSLVVSAILTVAGVCFTPGILRLMNTPADIMEDAVRYIRIYFAGGLSLVMYNSLRGIMQAVGDSRHPLIYLIISSIINVVLDIVFITALGAGVGGAALATVISQFISVFLCLRRLMRTEEDCRLCVREIGFDPAMLRLMLQYGIPAGVQNSVIGLANVVVQTNINRFGSMAVAGCGAYTKIEGFVFLPITSMTAAVATFVGQNLGAGEYDRARKGARFCLVSCISVVELVGIVIFAAAPVFVGAFTDEPAAIAFGVQKCRICSLFFFLMSMSHCLAAVLRGAGKATVPMATMLTFWCVVRVSILRALVPVFRTIAIVNWIYPITWSLTAVTLLIYYRRADWVHSFDPSPAVKKA